MPKARKADQLRVKSVPKIKLDDVDLLILSALQKNARVSNAEIARRARMVPSGILERLRKLTESRVILGYETRIDPRILGLGLVAFVQVTVDDRIQNIDTAGDLAKIPGVQEVHSIAGEDCYLVKMRAASPEELGHVLREKVRSIRSVLGTKTTIVLDTVKESIVLPLPADRGASK